METIALTVNYADAGKEVLQQTQQMITAVLPYAFCILGAFFAISGIKRLIY